MRKKDYYVILGISRTACVGTIRAAFRKLAKKHHPDLSGPEQTRRFQEIVEAYGILSDLEARERYDRSLRRSEERAAQSEKASRYADSAGAGSTFSEHEHFSGKPRPTERNSFLVDDFFERWSTDSPGAGFPGSRYEYRDVMDVEVILSQDEADRGGILPLALPITVRCPFCQGVGHTGLFACTYCHGRGSVQGKEAVRVRIPSGIKDGSTLEIRVSSHATAGVLLRIHIGVDAA